MGNSRAWRKAIPVESFPCITPRHSPVSGTFLDDKGFWEGRLTVQIDRLHDPRLIRAFGRDRPEIVRRAAAAGEDGQQPDPGQGQDPLCEIQRHLNQQAVKHPQVQAPAEHQVAQGIKDQAALIFLNALDYVRMMPDDQVCAGIDRRPRDLFLQRIVAGFVFIAEVAGIDDKVAAGFFQLRDLFGDPLRSLMPDGLAYARETDTDPAFLINKQAAISGEGDPGIPECTARAFFPS